MVVSESTREISQIKPSNTQTAVWWRGRLGLSSVLLLSLITGILYLSIIPPWQHYDEPAQFEYAWLIANRPGLPERGDYDQFARREIAASMVENNFFRDVSVHPNLVGLEPIWIGISQIGELPAYYWIAALPLRIMRYADVHQQVVFLRLVSLCLYLVTVYVAYKIACELTIPNHPLRWLLPASVALLPSFVDIMTAVNDDVGATAFFSIFLWAGIRLIRRGFNLGRFSALCLFAVLSFWTKNTVVFAVLLFFVPLLFSIFRETKKKFAWFAILGGAVLLSIAAFTWGDAALWYRSSSSGGLTRSEQSSPLGNSSIRLTITRNEVPPSLVQVISRTQLEMMKGRPVTFGAWIWASKPVKVRTPILIHGQDMYYQDILVDTKPKFFQITTTLRDINKPLIFSLSPFRRRIDQNLTVYYDGIVLTKGNHPAGVSPEFSDVRGESGIWNGVGFKNAIRNPSGESAWPTVRLWVDKLVGKYFPGRPSLVLASVLDASNFREYYSVTFKTLFQSFWARFGWGNVTLLGFHPYLILGFLTFIGCLGAGIYIIKNFHMINREIFFFLGLPFIVIWGSTLARGINSYVGNHFLVPVSRYAFPAIIPTMLLLDIGWMQVGKSVKISSRLHEYLIPALVLVIFLGINFLSIYSIYAYYFNY